ncbi:hypothetical protein GJ496_001386 [Pomphorhynchus laevis]|nr:hypothetical protein GJ496_001386 [Pomphorhynchus laevis]
MFSIQQFAKFYAKKFNLRVDALTKKLWGDFYIDKKTKKFKRCARAKGNKPLFVTLILDPIWSLFQSLTDRNASDVEKKCASLKIKYPSKITEEPDLRDRIMRIFHQWIPLSSILLDFLNSRHRRFKPIYPK